MTLSDLLVKVKSLTAAKAATAEESYRAAVRAAGQAKPLDAVKVVAVLDAAGKSAEQFESDVALYARRLQLRAKADEQLSYERARVAAEAKLKQLDAEFERTQAAYEAARWPVAAEVEELGKRIEASVTARGELRSTCSYPEVLDRVTRANRAAGEAGRRLHTLERQLTDAREKLDTLKHFHGKVDRHSGEFDHSRQIASLTLTVEKLPGEIEKARQDLADAEADRHDAEAALLAP